jgi:hypothetical protein
VGIRIIGIGAIARKHPADAIRRLAELEVEALAKNVQFILAGRVRRSPTWE